MPTATCYSDAPLYTLTLREICLQMTVHVHRWLHVYIIYGTCTCMCNMLQVPGVSSRGDSLPHRHLPRYPQSRRLSLPHRHLPRCQQLRKLSLTDTSLGVRSRGDSPYSLLMHTTLRTQHNAHREKSVMNCLS